MVKLFYDEKGKGNSILFIHGFGANTFTWRYLTKEFSQKYRCIAVDLKGFGKSPKPYDGKYSFFDHLEIILEFIKELNLKNFVIAGNSYGGGLALAIAEKFKDEKKENEIKGLILIDSMAYIQKLPSFMKVLTLPLISEILALIIPPKVATKNVLKEVWHNYSKVSNDIINQYRVKSLRDRYTAIQTARQLLKGNVREFVEKIKKINTKSLIIWGENDRIIPLKTAYKLKEDLKNSHLEIVKGCGHVPQEECPQKTIDIIYKFFKEIKF